MSPLYFEQVGPSTFHVMYGQVRLGELEREVDGDFVFYPVREGGSWSAWIMKEIATYLDGLNAKDGQ